MVSLASETSWLSFVVSISFLSGCNFDIIFLYFDNTSFLEHPFLQPRILYASSKDILEDALE